MNLVKQNKSTDNAEFLKCSVHLFVPVFVLFCTQYVVCCKCIEYFVHDLSLCFVCLQYIWFVFVFLLSMVCPCVFRCNKVKQKWAATFKRRRKRKIKADKRTELSDKQMGRIKDRYKQKRQTEKRIQCGMYAKKVNRYRKLTDRHDKLDTNSRTN